MSGLLPALCIALRCAALPLTKQLVELHGGTLSIASAESVGTEARVVIPGCSASDARQVA